MFALATVWGVVSIAAWVWMLVLGRYPTAPLTPFGWHAHEMVFGYVVAIIAGFLLANPDATRGRTAGSRHSLVLLAVSWLASRVAVASISVLSVPIAVVLAVGTTLLAGVLIVRRVVRERNPGDLVQVGVVVLLVVAQGMFVVEQTGRVLLRPGAGLRLGLDAVLVFLIAALVRIVTTAPSSGPDRRDRTWGRVSVLVAWVVAFVELAFDTRWAALVFAIAALVILLGTRLWLGARMGSGPLAWSLYVGYAWVGVSLVVRSVARFYPQYASLGVHTFTQGAVGTLTLVVMAWGPPAAGRTLRVPAPTVVAVVLMSVSAVLRVVGAFGPLHLYRTSVVSSAALWCAALCCFLQPLGRSLLGARAEGHRATRTSTSRTT